jgi:hypothetical protein
MINEEMQKTMQFIVEQQTRFAANMQRFEERQVKDRVSGVEERMTKIENVMLKLANVQVDGNKRMEGFEENMRRISAVQTETTERLNILVNTVERYIAERRNGS